MQETDFEDSLARGLGGTCHISGSAESLACPQHVAAFARMIGFEQADCTKIHIAAAELCTNVLRHGVQGSISYALITKPRHGLLLVTQDEGPGFDDIDFARKDGVSKGVLLDDEILPSQRESLGSGLGAVERMTHLMQVENLPGGGARVVAFVELEERQR